MDGADYDTLPTPAQQRYQSGGNTWEEEGMHTGAPKLVPDQVEVGGHVLA
jgi:hypothetical protein